MGEKEKNIAEEETMNKLVKEILKNGNVKTVFDVESKQKQSFGKIIQSMLETEIEEQLGHKKYEYTVENKENYRNGTTKKKVKSNLGEIELEIPRDRKGEFEPVIVPKHSRDISNIEQQIINLFAMGNSTREISNFIEDIYGFTVSVEMISDITDKIIPEIQEWQKRKLESVYPIIFIDATHFHVRDNGQIVKKAAYVVLGIDKDGMKKVLTITIGENESAKYWMTVLNELKNRGVQDILVLCADGLTGLKEAISAIYPKTEYQRCIVHQIRNSLKYVPYTDRKELANDLKTVYKASTEELGYTNLLELEEKWKNKYPGAIQSWIDNWDVLSVFFKFSAEIRKIMYTTNAIESLNSTYKRINKNRNVFPTDMSLLKVLYLSTLKAEKKWTRMVDNWDLCLSQFRIMYEGRI